MKTVVIGFLGSVLDVGKNADRWRAWRPSVAICRQPDLILHRFELLHPRRDATLAAQVRNDIRSVSPETEVRLHPIEFDDAWDFEHVYETLFAFARAYPFSDNEDYLVHITTGTHVAQICLFLLTEARWIPGRLLQASPSRDRSTPGEIKIIDLDLSRYDGIASRFRQASAEGVSFLKNGIATRNPAFNKLIDRIEHVALGGRVSVTDVREETGRLHAAWEEPANPLLTTHVTPETLAEMDLFDRLQLEKVLEICLRSRSLSEAGRELFSASQKRKASTNDADRLRKYLARFGVEWGRLRQPQSPTSGQ